MIRYPLVARSTPTALCALAAMIAAGSCMRTVFECTDADNCISRGEQGVCQATGYCSYPDLDCESEQRYDEFAGDGLAGSCVGEDPCEVPDCIDEDGDGFGIGADCGGPDCDDDNPAHADRCLYIAPGGDDAAAGTIDAPWGTFARALPELAPGTSLVLLDGTYEASTTGLLDIGCGDGGNAVDGTAEQPIAVRAEHERAALLVGGGAATAIRVMGCGFWRVNGLRAMGGDLLGSEGGTQSDLVYVSGVHDSVFRRLLVTHNNRIFNTMLVGIDGSVDVLFEEIEAYDFHRDAFQIYDSERLTFRRCYTNSRGHADLPDCNGEVDPEVPYCSFPADGGDSGFSIYQNVGGIRFENCVSEGRVGSGISIGSDSRSVAIRGSIVMPDADIGILVAAWDARPVTGTSIAETLVLAPRQVGVYLRSTTDTLLEGVTILRSGAHGLVADQTAASLCSELAGGCSFTATRLLVGDSVESGISVSDQDPWSLYACNAHGNGTDWPVDEVIDDDLDHIQRSASVDAGMGTALGQCAVYVPTESAVHGLTPDGEDIGATILWRVAGPPTDEPLWDPQTGAFPCGATVAGVNDEPTVSCTGLHTRLNVWSNGCEAPPDSAAPSTCAG